MAVKDCEQTWSGNAYRRLYPAYRTLVQIAAKVRFPPVAAVCADCSIRYTGLLVAIRCGKH
jgi:hypothetical protein